MSMLIIDDTNRRTLARALASGEIVLAREPQPTPPVMEITATDLIEGPFFDGKFRTRGKHNGRNHRGAFGKSKR